MIGFLVHLMANCRTLWINKRCLVESREDVIGQNTVHCVLANREVAICTKDDVNFGGTVGPRSRNIFDWPVCTRLKRCVSCTCGKLRPVVENTLDRSPRKSAAVFSGRFGLSAYRLLARIGVRSCRGRNTRWGEGSLPRNRFCATFLALQCTNVALLLHNLIYFSCPCLLF